MEKCVDGYKYALNPAKRPNTEPKHDNTLNHHQQWTTKPHQDLQKSKRCQIILKKHQSLNLKEKN
jgi:hypothetical protein